MQNTRSQGASSVVIGLTLLALTAPASAGSLGEAAELEHARANARAGGPVSERDAELLERYGCLSGTQSKFCQRLSARQAYRSSHRKVHRD
jgi:hypothetical protein